MPAPDVSNGSGSQENSKTQHDLVVRTNKIVTALYMVTDCIEDDEPLRKALRVRGIELIESVNRTIHGRAGGARPAAADALDCRSAISSLLSVAVSMGFVSSMNASILDREFEALAAMLSSMIGSSAGEAGMALVPSSVAAVSLSAYRPHADLGGQMPAPQAGSQPSMSRTSPAAPSYQPERSRDYHGRTDSRHRSQPAASAAPKAALPARKPEIKEQKAPVSVTADAPKTDRREIILKLVRQKGEVAIKDVTDLISDCSEKTIQRELVAMVESGILKKTGEKRWSRYSLA